jgi:ABC-2 type transport system ATP-binding protein
VIDIQNVTKTFGGTVAVRNLDLTVEEGELFAFLGPNGAGKTTTIKMITGLLTPTSGRIEVGSFDIQEDYLQAKSIISYIPDQPYMYEKLTGREFLYFLGEMYGMEKNQITRQISYLADLFECEGYLDNLAETYSHGMKQRVVVSGALMHRPDVILIDEPLVGLDPRSANILKSALRERVESGTTVFMSTHTLGVAEETADRVGIIQHGQMVTVGTLEEIYSRAETDRRLEDAFLRLTDADRAIPGSHR